MVDPVGLAGTIGTWVTVVLAILALISILTILQLWRDNRVRLDIALNSVNDRNKRFISPGLKFGTNVRIFRKVQIPVLRLGSFAEANRGPVSNAVYTANQPDSAEQQFEAGWAKFAVLLQKYTTEEESQKPLAPWRFAGKEQLVIRGERPQAWLPMDAAWVMAIALLGRYGLRDDQGTFTHVSQRVNPTFAPWYALEEGHNRFNRSPARRRSACEVIYGTTGNLGCLSQTEVSFDLQRRKEGQTLPIADETHSLRDLFCMAYGLLPCFEAQSVPLICLEDTRPPDINEDFLTREGKVARFFNNGFRKMPTVYRLEGTAFLDLFRHSDRDERFFNAFTGGTVPIIERWTDVTYDAAQSDQVILEIYEHYSGRSTSTSPWTRLPPSIFEIKAKLGDLLSPIEPEKRATTAVQWVHTRIGPKVLDQPLISKRDVHKMLDSLLNIRWSKRSISRRRADCAQWEGLLLMACLNYGIILHRVSLYGLRDLLACGSSPETVDVLKRQMMRTSKYASVLLDCEFHQRTTFTLMNVKQLLDKAIDQLEGKMNGPALQIVQILYVSDHEFRDIVDFSLVPPPEVRSMHEGDKLGIYSEQDKDELEKRVEEWQKHQDKKQEERLRKKRHKERRRQKKRKNRMKQEMIEKSEPENATGKSEILKGDQRLDSSGYAVQEMLMSASAHGTLTDAKGTGRTEVVSPDDQPEVDASIHDSGSVYTSVASDDVFPSEYFPSSTSRSVVKDVPGYEFTTEAAKKDMGQSPRLPPLRFEYVESTSSIGRENTTASVIVHKHDGSSVHFPVDLTSLQISSRKAQVSAPPGRVPEHANDHPVPSSTPPLGRMSSSATPPTTEMNDTGGSYSVTSTVLANDFVLLASIRAQTICYLWLTSLNSEDLVKFVGKLADEVLIGPLNPQSSGAEGV